MEGRTSSAHSFIVRLRLEPRERAGAPAVWYGTVVHVPSGATGHVKTVDEVGAFITAVLDGGLPGPAPSPPGASPDA